jgi:hypothetical protein
MADKNEAPPRGALATMVEKSWRGFEREIAKLKAENERLRNLAPAPATRELQTWLVFDDPGQGDVTCPIGPFKCVYLDREFLVTDLEEGQPPIDRLIAKYEDEQWEVLNKYAEQAAFDEPIFPRVHFEMRPMPPLREFTAKVRETREVAYRVMAKTQEEAQTILDLAMGARRPNDLELELETVDSTPVDHTIHTIEETTPPAEPVAEEGEPT